MKWSVPYLACRGLLIYLLLLLLLQTFYLARALHLTLTPTGFALRTAQHPHMVSCCSADQNSTEFHVRVPWTVFILLFSGHIDSLPQG
jgi:hypothetical protein